MPTRSRVESKALTAYEKQQVAEIAAWKSKPVNPVAEAWNIVVLQAAKAATFFVPVVVVRSAIELSYTRRAQARPAAEHCASGGCKECTRASKESAGGVRPPDASRKRRRPDTCGG